MSNYQEVIERIQVLSVEQQKLYLRAAKRELTVAQRRRLAEIREQLSDSWLKRKGLRLHCTDPLEMLMQARWTRVAGGG